MNGRDIYVKLTDTFGRRKPVINAHRVWDAELFMASQVEQYQGPKVPASERRDVSVATEDEYVAYQRKQRRG